MTATRPVALVTGASAGIGEQFSRQLGARGYDVVLVARSATELDRVAADIRSRGGVTAETLPADLLDPAGLARVTERLAAGVDLLVNNAGMAQSGVFATSDIAGEERTVGLNVTAVLRLTSAALGPMIARGSGAILTVSSLGGFQPVPGGAVYGASKAFITSWSEALAVELAGSGVRVTCLCPGYVRTDFGKKAGISEWGAPDWIWLSPEAVAKAGLEASDRNRPLVVPGPAYKVMATVSPRLPRSVQRLLGRRVLKSMT